MDTAAIRKLLAAYRDCTLFAGFSGGADSLALLLLLNGLRDECGYQLQAVHCEHGLRGKESLADADFCRNICRKYHIPLDVRSLDVPAHRRPEETVEAAARRMRLEVWRELAGNRPDAAVVLAHHAGDRRENLLLRLARGSGTSGLCGLRAERTVSRVRILRPLLHTEREDLESFLQEHGEHVWCEDATNADCHYRRNFVRHEILPRLQSALPYSRDGLNAALDAMEKDAELLETLAHQAAASLPPGGGDTAAWRRIPAALHGRVLRELFLLEQEEDWIPDRRFLQSFAAMLHAGTVGALTIMPGHFWGNGSGVWRFSAAEPPEKVHFLWQWQDQTKGGFSAEKAALLPTETGMDEAYFDRAQLPETLLVASGEDGDRMVPFGHRNPVLWKELRIKRGIARADAPPLLRLADGTILWSPLVRHSDFGKVNAETREIVRFRWKKES